jgi:anti-sigma regulatory factor (Ser/Thr protein kinase)
VTAANQVLPDFLLLLSFQGEGSETVTTAEIQSGIGPESYSWAHLAVQRENAVEQCLMVVSSVVEEVVEVRRKIGALARLDGFSEDDVFALQVAVSEALANAVCHGSPLGARDTVEICYRRPAPKWVEIVVSDHGAGFDLPTWLKKEDPLKLSDGERGLYLIAALMDEVSYTQVHGGGKLRIRKYFHTGSDEVGDKLQQGNAAAPQPNPASISS